MSLRANGDADRPPVSSRKNPYVGPRSFRRNDRLYGREREASELTDRLISERVVLLHAPSGAGKTSLIQAEVVPRLEREGFHVVGPLRLNAVAPHRVDNRYAWSAVVGMLRPTSVDETLRSMTLAQAAATLEQQVRARSVSATGDRVDAPGEPPDGDPIETVYIFDQVEELLTLDPTDVDGQRRFFEQLADLLGCDMRWVLLSIREDYMGGLDRYAQYVPGQLRASYRLDFLRRDAAARAIRLPACDEGVDFQIEAVDAIVGDLAKIKVQTPGRGPERVPGPYVEPVQLQVVCHRLWRTLLTDPSRTVIRPEDVAANQDLVTRALRKFYSDAVKSVAAAATYNEHQLRSWIDTELITTQGFRNQTMTGPEGAPGEILEMLEARYVIRSDVRGGVTWYELAHDRLVEPARESNDAWRERHLKDWRRSAELWRRGNEDTNYLLRGRDYLDARSSIRARDLTVNEQKFLEASRQAWREQRLFQKAGWAVSAVVVVAVVELVVAALIWLR